MKVQCRVKKDNFTIDKVHFFKVGDIIEVEESLAKGFPTLIELYIKEEKEKTLEDLTNSELKELIFEKGLELPNKPNKSKLIAILEGNTSKEVE